MKTVVSVEGLSLWGSAQGSSFYREALKAQNLEGGLCVDDLKCINDEIKAVGKYLKKNWRSIERDDRKVTSVLKTMYTGAIHYTLQAAGKWPTIFYSLIATAPNKVTAFEFENGRVSATMAPDTSHPSFSECEKEQLYVKSATMGAESLLTTPKSLFNQAVSMAASGMSLAMMVSFGNPTVRDSMIKAGIQAGSPAKIANLMSWCTGSAPGSDPQCHGKTLGRVAWGAEMPESMM